MSDTEPLVLRSLDGAIATITVNRPRALNALTLDTIHALQAAVEAVAEDTRAGRCRGLIVTGAGEKAFVGGADVRYMRELDVEGGRVFITALHQSLAAIRRLDVLTVAAVNGFALGAGLELAAACDLRVAAEHARMGMPEVRVGLPSVIEAALLPRLVGDGRAAEIVLLGDMVDAATAERWGLVNRVVPADQVLPTARAWAEQAAGFSPHAIRLQKETFRRWQEGPLESSIAAGIPLLALAFSSDHPHEAMQAFLEKRPPRYS